MRKRLFLVGIALVAGVFAGCYGKDTGPKKPRAKESFMPTLEKFTARASKCLPEMVQANLKRPMKEEEKGNESLKKGAVSNLRTELLQCFTGKGYGNEVQIESKHVKEWLAQPDCAGFAKAVFASPRCAVIQMTLEDSGFPM